ncbi:MAG: hypothetical protein JWP35_2351 [Caulobacter sp.]|nr:hypothetical protein [Caulobacter sp.]
MRRLVVAFALTAVLVGATGSAEAQGGFAPVGVILTAEQASRDATFIPGGKPYWTPTLMDVGEAETALGPYLRKAALPERAVGLVDKAGRYRKQFVGVTMSGRRILLLNAVCDASINLHDHYVIVADGGDCFFQAFYDIDTHRFVGIDVNGLG